jgi:hypothetical protein
MALVVTHHYDCDLCGVQITETRTNRCKVNGYGQLPNPDFNWATQINGFTYCDECFGPIQARINRVWRLYNRKQEERANGDQGL